MPNNERLKFISDHCSIYYDGMLISSEQIIRDYSLFLASNGKRIKTVLHTGSICFDVISVVYTILFSVINSSVSVDEIINNLKVGDMVIYGGRRQRWQGIEECDGEKYIVIKEDDTTHPGSGCITKAPYERAKSRIRPYYGTSQTTGGTGVKSSQSNRNDFLSRLLNLDIQEIPSAYDFKINVLSPKDYFENIFKKTTIRYDDEKTVSLSDLLLPLSYCTRNGEEKQIGANQTKSSPNIYYAEKAAIIRDLAMENRDSSILVLKEPSDSEGYSEFDDILRLSSLQSILLSVPLATSLSVHLIELDFDSSIYACTKDYLSKFSLDIVKYNHLTNRLSTQLKNIAKQNVIKYGVYSDIDANSYCELRRKLRNLNWNSDQKNEFQRYAFSMLKLFSSSFFTMNELETAISSERVSMNVLSPGERIEKVSLLAKNSSNDDCSWLANELEKMYVSYFENNPKREALEKILNDNRKKKVLLVMSKSYYIDIFNLSDLATENVSCTTIDRFEPRETYDVVIAMSSAEGKRFNPVNCASARTIYILLYDYEKRLYALLSKKHSITSKKIEAKIEGKTPTEIDEIAKSILTAKEENEIKESREIDDFLESLSIPDLSKIANYSSLSSTDSAQLIEAHYVGSFTSGENILFTKNYRGVVFDQDKNMVEEKPVEELVSGDLLIFMKKDDYTRNIVDYLFDKLLEANKLSDDIPKAYEMSKHWKEALRKYKEEKKATYRRIMWEFSKLGSTLREVTIRQWLVDDSHIVGPRDIETMEKIAMITNDEKLLSAPQDYFNACKKIRTQRIEILKLISLAINDRFNGNNPEPGSILEMVYENVEKLSITLELEKILELPEPKNVNRNAVNKPLIES